VFNNIVTKLLNHNLQIDKLLNSENLEYIKFYTKLFILLFFQGNKQFILNYFLSISVIAQLGEVARADAQGRVSSLLDEYFSGNIQEIEIPFESEFYCVKKI